VSFIAWLAVTALHVLAHLADSQHALTAEFGTLPTGTPRASRRTARLLLIGTGLIIGLLIALVSIPDFTASQLWHHHHGM
jgi:hypothetical protein